MEVNTPRYNGLLEQMGKDKSMAGVRGIIVADVWQVQTACGYGVPLATPDGFVQRETLDVNNRKKVNAGLMVDYQIKWNSKSLDGCRGLKIARRNAGEWLFLGDIQSWYWRTLKNWDTLLVGVLVGVVIMLLVSFFQPYGLGDYRTIKFAGDW